MYLPNCYAGRAKTLNKLERYAEAVQDWDRAIELSPPAEQTGLRASRASSRLLAGQVSEAVAEVACLYAVASKSGGINPPARRQYADRAMELLHKAIKAGYKDAAQMNKDTELEKAAPKPMEKK